MKKANIYVVTLYAKDNCVTEEGKIISPSTTVEVTLISGKTIKIPAYCLYESKTCVKLMLEKSTRKILIGEDYSFIQDGDESETYILKETSKLDDYSEFLKFRNIKPAFSTVASFDFTSEEKALEAIEEFKKCNTNVIYMDGIEW